MPVKFVCLLLRIDNDFMCVVFWENEVDPSWEKSFNKLINIQKQIINNREKYLIMWKNEMHENKDDQVTYKADRLSANENMSNEEIMR